MFTRALGTIQLVGEIFRYRFGLGSDLKRSRNSVAGRWGASKDALIRTGLLPVTAAGEISPFLCVLTPQIRPYLLV